jgi:O-antigen ligase
MWVLPFLYYHHAYPLTTFYQEWGAALISMCAMPLLISKRYWQQAEIPRIVLLPIGMLLLLLLQYLLGRLPSFDQTLLLCLYFLWIFLLLMLGHRLRVEIGLPLLATVLAMFLVLGAELNALAGLIQHYHWHTFLNSVVTVQVAGAVYGNIAQPNHFANYLTLGLVSIGLLYFRNALRVWQVMLLVLPMLFVLALSGSRSIWVFLLFLIGFSYLWQRRDPSYRPALKYAAALLVGFIMMIFVVQIPWLEGTSGTSATTHRMFADGSSGGIRLYLWHESWMILARFPVWGAGFGQFAWQHFQLGGELQNPGITGLYNNAHNLVLELAPAPPPRAASTAGGDIAYSQCWESTACLSTLCGTAISLVSQP